MYTNVFLINVLQLQLTLKSNIERNYSYVSINVNPKNLHLFLALHNNQFRKPAVIKNISIFPKNTKSSSVIRDEINLPISIFVNSSFPQVILCNQIPLGKLSKV